MLTKALFLLTVLSVLCLTACDNDAPATGAPSPSKQETSPPRPVQAVAAVEERVSRGTVVTGTLAAKEQIVLSFKIPGRLRDLTVDLGSPVRQGQIIARLDPLDFRLRVQQAEATLQQARAQLGLPLEGTDDRVDPAQTPVVRQARATLDQAERNHQRAVKLSERQLIPRADLDTAATAFQVAEGRYHDAMADMRTRQAILSGRRSELDIARQQLLDSALQAPIDGVVRQRHVTAGEYMEVGAPTVTIVRLHPLRLQLAVPERATSQVRLGQAVQVKVVSDPQVYHGTVARVSPTMTPEDRTLSVEAEIPNAHGRLRPGAFAEAEMMTATEERVVFVPAAALVTFAGLEKVFTVRDGMSVEKRVRTGRRVGPQVEIVEGLAAGELVVVEPGTLSGGQPVALRP